MVAEKASLTAGQHPLNKVDFDRSGQVVVAASDDGSIKVFDVASKQCVSVLRGHDDAVQAVAFDPTSKMIVSGSSDCTFRVWGSS
jgi:WD40 repeat protein